jgi:ribA/ribD-fused uncharacterized protein
MPPINQFRGDYAFLSNFWPYQGKQLIGPPAPIVWKGVTYQTAEHLYQAAKPEPDDIFNRERIITAETPGLAKQIGGEVKLRAGWDEIKHHVMIKTVEAKFLEHKDLGHKLLGTGDEELLEGNTWGDTHWGVDLRTSIGENWLGRILMIVRAELRFKEELQAIVNEMRMGMRVDCSFQKEAA